MSTLHIVSPPVVGTLVRRIEDGKIGRVAHVAVAGTTPPFCLPLPLVHGDVVVSIGPGHDTVCCGETFWTRWQPVAVRAMQIDPFEGGGAT